MSLPYISYIQCGLACLGGAWRKTQGPTTETLAGCRKVASLTPQPGGRLDRTSEAKHIISSPAQPKGRRTTSLCNVVERRGEEGRERGGEREGIDTNNTTDMLSEVGPGLKPPPLGPHIRGSDPSHPIPCILPSDTLHAYMLAGICIVVRSRSNS